MDRLVERELLKQVCVMSMMGGTYAAIGIRLFQFLCMSEKFHKYWENYYLHLYLSEYKMCAYILEGNRGAFK